MAQKSGGRIYLLGIVSYGPIDCSNNEAGRPDVYTDVRAYARYMRSETAYYDKSRLHTQTPSSVSSPESTPPDGLSVLAPNCGNTYCFRSDTSECTFHHSFYVKCQDQVVCHSDLIPDDTALVSGGSRTFTAASVGGLLSVRNQGGPTTRCTKWIYYKIQKRWRCRSFKRVKRKRRQEDGNENYLNLLVCPVLSCIEKKVIRDEWSTPDQCPQLKNVSQTTPPDQEKGKKIKIKNPLNPFLTWSTMTGLL